MTTAWRVACLSARLALAGLQRLAPAPGQLVRTAARSTPRLGLAPEPTRTPRPAPPPRPAGPTGVGKSELAKTLASYYFGSEEAMVRLAPA